MGCNLASPSLLSKPVLSWIQENVEVGALSQGWCSLELFSSKSRPGQKRSVHTLLPGLSIAKVLIPCLVSWGQETGLASEAGFQCSCFQNAIGTLCHCQLEGTLLPPGSEVRRSRFKLQHQNMGFFQHDS